MTTPSKQIQIKMKYFDPTEALTNRKKTHRQTSFGKGSKVIEFVKAAVVFVHVRTSARSKRLIEPVLNF